MNSPPEQGSAEISREPFSPGGPQSKWSGGPSWALLGCGALILLLGIGSVVFLLKAKDLFGWMMNELEAQVMESLPANITETQMQELSAAFDGAVEAVREDRANVVALQELQKMLRESLGNGPNRLSREEVQSLIEALDRVSGRKSGDDVDRPESEQVEATQTDQSLAVPSPIQ
jgi:Ca2+-binding EF-hand superfamily protein